MQLHCDCLWLPLIEDLSVTFDAVQYTSLNWTCCAVHEPNLDMLCCAGGDEAGDDQACLLSATWREMRHSVFERGAVSQFRFRQFLFACQARILLKLQRHTEVLDLHCLSRTLPLARISLHVGP